MSIHKMSDGVFEVRWREGGRNKSLWVHGSYELARKIERKKMSVRDENRHLDVKREVNFRMSALIDRYWTHYGAKKRSAGREKSILEGIRDELGSRFVREVDGVAVSGWYEKLTALRELSAGTAVRHFNVMHHMMEKAATIWSKETGIDRNPADQVEVKRPDDQRDRYLSAEELGRLKQALDERTYRKGTKAINKTFYRLRLIVLIAVTTGMRASEIFRSELERRDVQRRAVGGEGEAEGRQDALCPDASRTRRRAAAVSRRDWRRSDFSAETRCNEQRQRVEGSFEDLLKRQRSRISAFTICATRLRPGS